MPQLLFPYDLQLLFSFFPQNLTDKATPPLPLFFFQFLDPQTFFLLYRVRNCPHPLSPSSFSKRWKLLFFPPPLLSPSFPFWLFAFPLVSMKKYACFKILQEYFLLYPIFLPRLLENWYFFPFPAIYKKRISPLSPHALNFPPYRKMFFPLDESSPPPSFHAFLEFSHKSIIPPLPSPFEQNVILFSHLSFFFRWIGNPSPSNKPPPPQIPPPSFRFGSTPPNPLTVPFLFPVFFFSNVSPRWTSYCLSFLFNYRGYSRFSSPPPHFVEIEIFFFPGRTFSCFLPSPEMLQTLPPFCYAVRWDYTSFFFLPFPPLLSSTPRDFFPPSLFHHCKILAFFFFFPLQRMKNSLSPHVFSESLLFSTDGKTSIFSSRLFFSNVLVLSPPSGKVYSPFPSRFNFFFFFLVEGAVGKPRPPPLFCRGKKGRLPSDWLMFPIWSEVIDVSPFLRRKTFVPPLLCVFWRFFAPLPYTGNVNTSKPPVTLLSPTLH